MSKIDESVQSYELALDFKRMLEPADVGVRRASAFMKLGLVSSEGLTIDDFSLAGGTVFRFWPTPVAEDTAREVRDEYLCWLIGSCLRELDQHFSIFLDRTWRLLELADFHDKVVHSSHRLDSTFEAKTNVSKKLRYVSEKLAIEPALDCFESLSLARNTLTHAAGYVRSRDTNDDGTLNIMWISPEIMIRDGEEVVTFGDAVSDMRVIKSKDGAQVYARIRKNSSTFSIGDKISLSPHNLAEICFFYWQQSRLVYEGVRNYCDDLGIPLSVSPPSANETSTDETQ